MPRAAGAPPKTPPPSNVNNQRSAGGYQGNGEKKSFWDRFVCFIEGRLVRDIEEKYINGKATAKFTVARSCGTKTAFHNFTAWDESAVQVLASGATKGTPVIVDAANWIEDDFTPEGATEAKKFSNWTARALYIRRIKSNTAKPAPAAAEDSDEAPLE